MSYLRHGCRFEERRAFLYLDNMKKLFRKLLNSVCNNAADTGGSFLYNNEENVKIIILFDIKYKFGTHSSVL